ncbi:MAG: hypothetical protein PHS37_05970, partial [Candidatus Omnitrophica bacterium]|nr:hypothetical protein [Candidatus Omnitrophota bacterium]
MSAWHEENNDGMIDWRRRHALFFKTISIVLIITFLLFDITWAQGGTPIWEHAKPSNVGAYGNTPLRNNITVPY